MSRWSLRSRVTAAVVVLVVATLVILSVAVDVALRHRLSTDLRSRLTQRAVSATALDGRVTAQAMANRLSGQGIVASVVTPDGRTLVGRATAAGAVPAVRNRRQAAAARAAIQQQGDYLVINEPLPSGNTLILEADISQIQRTIDRLRVLETAVSLLLILTVGLIVNLVSKTALAPLDRMTETAREITAGQRGRRLRPASPTTEIGRTAAAIDEMLDALEASELTMRDFVSDASHELRTPIAGLQAGAETLLRSDLSREEREALAVSMVRESQRATRLVDDLLAVSRLDSQSVDLQPADLAEIARTAADDYQRRNPNVTVTLDAMTPVAVKADRDLMLQVMSNLLDNAGRATPGNQPIEVAVIQSPDGPEVSVTDHGPGVPDADRERIFQRFVRLDRGRERASGGNGLGLAIVRGLATLHGGRVWCEARHDRDPGARFVVRLPKP